jgi:large subunit ribosomal protein L6
MSRIGKLPIKLPKGVDLKISDAQNVIVTGPHGELNYDIPSALNLSVLDNIVTIEPKILSKKTRAVHGLVRTLVNNMVIGVSDKFTRKLLLKGVGYRAQVTDNNLLLSLGFSHEISLQVPLAIDVKVDGNTTINISGIEKEQVGLFASKIRSLRVPEPYNGKGVLYDGEILIRKAGKVGK